ncbi:MAG: hypothetical protein GY807_20470 [Gammaproteobacteria bacterium]|nr:hypothetical protein [Gammaproteobacteria bacterium]
MTVRDSIVKDIEKHVEELTGRVQTLESRQVLTPYETKVIKWTAKAVSGLAVLAGLAISVSSLKDVWENFLQ